MASRHGNLALESLSATAFHDLHDRYQSEGSSGESDDDEGRCNGSLVREESRGGRVARMGASCGRTGDDVGDGVDLAVGSDGTDAETLAGRHARQADIVGHGRGERVCTRNTKVGQG